MRYNCPDSNRGGPCPWDSGKHCVTAYIQPIFVVYIILLASDSSPSESISVLPAQGQTGAPRKGNANQASHANRLQCKSRLVLNDGSLFQFRTKMNTNSAMDATFAAKKAYVYFGP